VPVIAIDGPSGSGKGTIARCVARELGFHYLDSGLLYRVTALAARRAGVDLSDEERVAQLAHALDVTFAGDDVWLAGERVTDLVRSEACGSDASRVASLPRVRAALLDRQRDMRLPPGLVADGRDMGSVVFPDASLKIYLTASADERARRRYKQLIEKGMHATMEYSLEHIRERDARDSTRAVAPLQIGADAGLLDTTSLTIDAVVNEVVRRYLEVSKP
jgi:cytidylate kinase